MDTANGLAVGDRIELSGGYEPDPSWLGGKPSIRGRLTAFIPGQNRSPAAVVELDEALSGQSVSGSTIVLELRLVGAEWAATEVVHVELCDFIPEPTAWKDRRQGEWVESHANYRLVSE